MAAVENLYTGDGSTVLFSFTFPYLDPAHVKASLDGVDTTEYTLANATTVEFNAAPANGAAIRIYRSTSVAEPAATFYPGSAIRAQDLNDNFEQALFVIQEADFNTTQSANDSALALATAQTAATKSDSATSTANAALSASSAAQTSAAQAQADATAAQASAASAQSSATSAAASASTAATDAATAVTGVTTLTNEVQGAFAIGTDIDVLKPIIATKGVQLPTEVSSTYQANGALRYNDSLDKIELYNGAVWQTAATGASIASTPPIPATGGDVWYDKDNGRAYVYYNDGDSNQWVEMSPSWNGSIADNSVSTAKIQDGSVTAAKLAPDVGLSVMIARIDALEAQNATLDARLTALEGGTP